MYDNYDAEQTISMIMDNHTSLVAFASAASKP